MWAVGGWKWSTCDRLELSYLQEEDDLCCRAVGAPCSLFETDAMRAFAPLSLLHCTCLLAGWSLSLQLCVAIPPPCPLPAVILPTNCNIRTCRPLLILLPRLSVPPLTLLLLLAPSTPSCPAAVAAGRAPWSGSGGAEGGGVEVPASAEEAAIGGNEARVSSDDYWVMERQEVKEEVELR